MNRKDLKSDIHENLLDQIPITINQSFNRNLQTVIDHHQLFGSMPHPMIDLSIKPNVGSLRKYRSWLDALITVIIIGSRMHWIHWNVNRSGQGLYLTLETENMKQGKD